MLFTRRHQLFRAFNRPCAITYLNRDLLFHTTSMQQQHATIWQHGTRQTVSMPSAQSKQRTLRRSRGAVAEANAETVGLLGVLSTNTQCFSPTVEQEATVQSALDENCATEPTVETSPPGYPKPSQPCPPSKSPFLRQPKKRWRVAA